MNNFFHKFKFLNKYFIFFPISGSLIEVDEEFYKTINKKRALEDSFFKEEYEIYKNFKLDFKPPESLKSLCLLISQKCNMKCDYCFVDEGKFRGKESLMSRDVALKAVDFLLKNSKTDNLEIDFFGGEPLLNWDTIKEVVLYGNKESKRFGKRIRYSLTTNGILLDREKIDFLNENMISLIISLDGPKEVNDKFRKLKNGKGSFDIVFEKIQELVRTREEGYYIRGTFTEKTKEISEYAKFFYENGIKNVSLEPVVVEKGNPLKIKDMKKIKREYEKLGKYIYNEKLKGNRLNFYHFLISLDSGSCLGKMSFGCGAGVEYLAVDTYGNLYPCHFLSDNTVYKMGDIFNGIDEEKKKKFIEYNKLSNKEKCKNCWAKYLCGGGCLAHSILINNDPLNPPKEFCELQRKRVEIGLILSNY